MIDWNEKFETGIKTIDEQHKMLILHINQLEDMLLHTHPTPQQIRFAVSLVDFLEQYAKTHFGFEEQCMECHRCPVHEENQRQHATFIEFFNGFHAEFKHHGYSMEAFKNLHRTTSTWITSHILRTDTQLKAYVKA